MNVRPIRAALLAPIVATVLAVGLLASACSSGATPAGTAATSPAHATHTEGLSTKQSAFHDAMRKLWEDHITWTRLFIVDFASGSPETKATTDRLLQNQVDIGDAIVPFYGAAAGAKLTDLLKEHILTAADLLGAARDGDQAKIERASTTWYANAQDIAAFLSGADPEHWPLAEMQSMMKSHLDLTLQEALAHLKGQFKADIAAYDRVHAEILDMADMLSAGIIAQFPDSF